MPESKFSQYARDHLHWWLEYFTACWKYAGCPENLDPSRIFQRPVEHNAETYRWLERKHQRSLAAVDTIIRKSVAASARQCPPFGKVWPLAYNPQSVWKQIRPLFAFSEALGGVPVNAQFFKLIAAYIFSQGVPSMLADFALDADERHGMRGYDAWHLPFSMICSANASALLQQLSDAARYFDVLQKYMREMYERMWIERSTRYCLPDSVSNQTIRQYLHGDSRLLSSVFHGICCEWAHILAGADLSQGAADTSTRLRRIRQLNDEIADIDEDFFSGLCTLPTLYALCDGRIANELRAFTQTSWAPERIDRRSEGGTPSPSPLNLREYLNTANALENSAMRALEYIVQCMQWAVAEVSSNRGFEMALLLTHRLTFLLRLSNNGWREVDFVYYPPLTSRLAK